MRHAASRTTRPSRRELYHAARARPVAGLRHQLPCSCAVEPMPALSVLPPAIGEFRTQRATAPELRGGCPSQELGGVAGEAMPRAADLPCVAVRRLSEAVNKSWSSRIPCRTFGARRVWPFSSRPCGRAYLLPPLRGWLGSRCQPCALIECQINQARSAGRK